MPSVPLATALAVVRCWVYFLCTSTWLATRTQRTLGSGWFGKGSSVRLVVPLRLSFLFPLAAVLPLSSVLRTFPLADSDPSSSRLTPFFFLFHLSPPTHSLTRSLTCLFSAPGSEWNPRYSLPVLLYPPSCVCSFLLVFVFAFPPITLPVLRNIPPDPDPDPDPCPHLHLSSSCSCSCLCLCSCPCSCSSNVVLLLSHRLPSPSPVSVPVSVPVRTSRSIDVYHHPSLVTRPPCARSYTKISFRTVCVLCGL